LLLLVITEAEDDARNSHLLFTLNVYQYKVDHDNSGQEEGSVRSAHFLHTRWMILRKLAKKLS